MVGLQVKHETLARMR